MRVRNQGWQGLAWRGGEGARSSLTSKGVVRGPVLDHKRGFRPALVGDEVSFVSRFETLRIERSVRRIIEFFFEGSDVLIELRWWSSSIPTRVASKFGPKLGLGRSTRIFSRSMLSLLSRSAAAASWISGGAPGMTCSGFALDWISSRSSSSSPCAWTATGDTIAARQRVAKIMVW